MIGTFGAYLLVKKPLKPVTTRFWGSGFQLNWLTGFKHCFLPTEAPEVDTATAGGVKGIKFESWGWKGDVKILLAMAAENVHGSNPGGIRGKGNEYLAACNLTEKVLVCKCEFHEKICILEMKKYIPLFW